VPPESRFVPRFVAEPSQESLPYGRWGQQLGELWVTAVQELPDLPADLGELSEIVWYPDRSWHGRTYVPATCRTGGGYELWGYVRYLPADQSNEDDDTDDANDTHGEPRELIAKADFTDETAEQNPDWKIDLCDEPIGRWRGEGGAAATMTLIWGRPMVAGGKLVTAELGGVAVDQTPLVHERFTLIAPDDYRGDLLQVKLWDGRARELACESLYEDDADSA
jgi:hypothetical protein